MPTYLKGGLVYADAITTVSNTYAEEIKTPFYGEGLDGLLQARSNMICVVSSTESIMTNIIRRRMP